MDLLLLVCITEYFPLTCQEWVVSEAVGTGNCQVFSFWVNSADLNLVLIYILVDFKILWLFSVFFTLIGELHEMYVKGTFKFCHMLLPPSLSEGYWYLAGILFLFNWLGNLLELYRSCFDRLRQANTSRSPFSDMCSTFDLK